VAHASGFLERSRLKDFTMNETRFRMVEKLDPKRFEMLQEQAQLDALRRTEIYRQMSQIPGGSQCRAQGRQRHGWRRGVEPPCGVLARPGP
jgi:hypothetical protein